MIITVKTLILSMIIAFVTTYFITPYAMKFLYSVGVTQIDLHKRNKPRLPAGGGVCVAFGILAGLLTYIGIQTFLHGTMTISISLLAAISSILLVTFGGFLDDLNVKSRVVETKDGKNVKVGFPQWLKPLLTLPAAIPLMVISAGVTTMAVPLFGVVDFGIIYPLILIPIGVVGASNMVNLLGGFNGLEAGMGLIYTLGLGIYALFYGSIGSVPFLIAAATLLAFLKYNWYPARILPGDSLTYLLGSLVATGAIIGNIEKAAVIAMIPFFIEFILKLRSKLKASSLGNIQPDGTIKSKYDNKIYSLTHLVMGIGKFTEREIVVSLLILQVIFVIIPFINLF